MPRNLLAQPGDSTDLIDFLKAQLNKKDEQLKQEREENKKYIKMNAEQDVRIQNLTTENILCQKDKVSRNVHIFQPVIVLKRDKCKGKIHLFYSSKMVRYEVFMRRGSKPEIPNCFNGIDSIFVFLFNKNFKKYVIYSVIVSVVRKLLREYCSSKGIRTSCTRKIKKISKQKKASKDARKGQSPHCSYLGH